MYSYHYSLSCRNTAQTSVHNDTRQGTPPPTQQRLYPDDNTRKRVSSSSRLGVTCLRQRGDQVSSLTKRRVLVSGCNLQKQCRAARRQTHARPLLGNLVAAGHHFLLRRSSDGGKAPVSVYAPGLVIIYYRAFHPTRGYAGAQFPGDSERIWLVGRLNCFNAELSPKRYWRGPRSREMGEEGDYIPNAALSPSD